MDAGPRISSYEWRGGREPMLRFGPEDGPVVVLALPLFEEANRTRAFGVTLCRRLARRGLASVLPDLPGQGESLVLTSAATLAGLRDAFASAADAAGEGHPYSVAIRSGALLDTAAVVAGRWHFAPVLGDAAYRELVRTARAADPQREDLDPVEFDRPEPIVIAGNLVAHALLWDIGASRPERARIVRLQSAGSDAALKVSGPALWRQAEPGNDHCLAERLAEDVADWVRACEG